MEISATQMRQRWESWVEWYNKDWKEEDSERSLEKWQIRNRSVIGKIFFIQIVFFQKKNDRGELELFMNKFSRQNKWQKPHTHSHTHARAFIEIIWALRQVGEVQVLRALQHILDLLPDEVVKIVACSMIWFPPRVLQRFPLQHVGARRFECRKFEHITPALKELPWLPVHYRATKHTIKKTGQPAYAFAPAGLRTCSLSSIVDIKLDFKVLLELHWDLVVLDIQPFIWKYVHDIIRVASTYDILKQTKNSSMWINVWHLAA